MSTFIGRTIPSASKRRFMPMLPEMWSEGVNDDDREAVNILEFRWDSKGQTGFVGLRNIGATCYMNSFLQTIYFTKKLRRVSKESPSESESPPNTKPREDPFDPFGLFSNRARMFRPSMHCQRIAMINYIVFHSLYRSSSTIFNSLIDQSVPRSSHVHSGMPSLSIIRHASSTCLLSFTFLDGTNPMNSVNMTSRSFAAW